MLAVDTTTLRTRLIMFIITAAYEFTQRDFPGKSSVRSTFDLLICDV